MFFFSRNVGLSCVTWVSWDLRLFTCVHTTPPPPHHHWLQHSTLPLKWWVLYAVLVMGSQPQQYIQLRQSHSASKIRISLMWDSLVGLLSHLFRWNCLKLAVDLLVNMVCTITSGICKIRLASTGVNVRTGREGGKGGKCDWEAMGWHRGINETKQTRTPNANVWNSQRSDPELTDETKLCHNCFLRSWIRVLRRLNTTGDWWTAISHSHYVRCVFVFDLTLCSMINTQGRLRLMAI